MNQLADRVVGYLVDWNRTRSAIWLSTTFTRLRPRDPESWIRCSRAMERLGRLDDSERVLREGLSKEADAPVLQLRLTELLIVRSRPREAAEMLQDLEQEFPRSPLVYSGLAKLHVSQGDWDKMREAASKAESLSVPDTFEGHEALRSLGGSLMDAGEVDWAERVFEKVASTWNDPAAYLYIGVLAQRSNRPEYGEQQLKLARKYWSGSRGSFSRTVDAVVDLIEGKD